MRTLVVAATLIAAGGSASAGPTEDAVVLKAREHFGRGQDAYKAGDYVTALVEYEEGYRLSPRPGFLLNMAQAARALGDLRRARDLYHRFLLADPNTPQRQAVIDVLTEIEMALGEQASRAPRPPPGAVPYRPPASTAPPPAAPPAPPRGNPPPASSPPRANAPPPAPQPAYPRGAAPPPAYPPASYAAPPASSPAAPQPAYAAPQARPAAPAAAHAIAAAPPSPAIPPPAPPTVPDLDLGEDDEAPPDLGVSGAPGQRPGADLRARGGAGEPKPAVYATWWFWTLVGTIAVGAGVAVFVAGSPKSGAEPAFHPSGSWGALR